MRLYLPAPRYWRADLFDFNVKFGELRAARAASLRLCQQIAWACAVGPPDPALPFQPAKHIAPPYGEPCWHRPDRSSGPLLRNKAAPWREDALGPTLDFHSLSEPENCSSPNTRLPWAATGPTIPLVYGSTHFGAKSCREPGVTIWCGRAAHNLHVLQGPSEAGLIPVFQRLTFCRA